MTTVYPKDIKKRYKKFFIIAILAVLIPVLVVFGVYTWYQNAVFSPASSDASTTIVEVTEGMNLATLGDTLQTAGALKNSFALKVYLRLNPNTAALQKGSYKIPKNLNIPDLLALLAKGPTILTVKFVTPEGLRYDEVVNIINEAYTAQIPDGKLNTKELTRVIEQPDSYKFSKNVQEFLDKYKPKSANLEGYLFPDTYIIGADAEPVDIIGLMVDNLRQKIIANKLDIDHIKRLKDLHAVLTLASVVQREAGVLDDMKMTADIFLKRLEQGIVLGSDPIILYPYKRWNPEPTRVELSADNSYNSRIKPGLPPTPIANPGIDAITAVLNPTPNPYFFFISDAKGKKYYARTLAEHEQNIQKYL